MDDDLSSTGGGGGGDFAPVTISTINFVDLAGSERLSQAGNDDNMEKEKLRQKEVR